jgi:hypothetical protein
MCSGDQMTTAVFAIKESDHSWGDYSNILIHGMSLHLGRLNGLIQLERTGPFMPPVTLPGIHDVIVTAAAKEFLEQSVNGLRFQPVIKARIVRLEWHLWDASLDDPPIFPNDGEPEGYILERPHDPDLSEELGDLWGIVPAIIPDCQLPGGVFNRKSYSGQPFLCANELGGYGFVSDQLKEALEGLASDWITFDLPSKNSDT